MVEKTEMKINLRELEGIIALIVFKKEEPNSIELALFGWDGRYEHQGKKGMIFDRPIIAMLNALGLKEEQLGTDKAFIDFDQLLSLYPYAECILNVLEAHHTIDVQNIIEQIKELENMLTLARQQLKEAEHKTFHKILACKNSGK